jgi:uncharacterized protein YpmB
MRIDSRKVKVMAGLVCVSFVMPGCKDNPEAAGVLSGIGAGIAAGAIAKGSGAKTGSAIAIGALAGLATGVIVYAISKHEADKEERERAKQEAIRQQARIAELERQAQARANTKKEVEYVVVPVNDKKDEVMIVKKDGTPVNNQVYKVDPEKARQAEKDAEQKGELAKFEGYDVVFVN